MESKEIRFRAWDPDEQAMWWFDLSEVWQFEDKINSLNLMQFTGLQDDNDTDIYEGDIIQYYISAPWDDEVPLLVTGEITFGNPFFGCFCVKSESDATGCLYEYFNTAKIIGNIYENPELLKRYDLDFNPLENQLKNNKNNGRPYRKRRAGP